jgi:hypothetical protein
MVCEKCGREWQEFSEQAACIRVYGQCIVCCVEMEKAKNYNWSVEQVQLDRVDYMRKSSNGMNNI